MQQEYCLMLTQKFLAESSYWFQQDQLYGNGLITAVLTI